MIKQKTVVTFGSGDIRITPVHNKIGVVALKEVEEPHTIGQRVEIESDYAYEDSDVLLEFSNTASIDVLVSALQEAKDIMNKARYSKRERSH